MDTKLEAVKEQTHNAIQTAEETGRDDGTEATELAGTGCQINPVGWDVDYTKPVTFTLTDLGIWSETYSKLQATATAGGILSVCWQANSATDLNTLYWCVTINDAQINREYVKCAGSYIYTGVPVKYGDVIEIIYPTVMEWMEASTYIRVFPYTGTSYSTDEQVIGTWIDGKPIYRRVVEVTLGAAARTNNPVLDLTGWNIDTVVRMNGSYTTLAGAICPVNYYRDNPSNITTFISASGWLSECHGTLANLKEIPGRVILEYTKTTD